MERKQETLLSVQGLNKHYGNLHAVNDLSLIISKGEIFGLLGPNGAGKSTTIECILGTIKADSGNIDLLGTAAENRKPSLFESVGVQFQNSHYPDLIKVDELCKMRSILYSHPADYRALLNRFSLSGKEKNRVSDLSGGEKQKLSLVLALINKPSIVFLDELTTGLDPEARRDVWSYLNLLKEQGMTIFLTSHYMDEVRYLCDRIMITAKGREIICGTPEDVINRSGTGSMEDAYLYFVKKGENVNETPVYTV